MGKWDDSDDDDDEPKVVTKPKPKVEPKVEPAKVEPAKAEPKSDTKTVEKNSLEELELNLLMNVDTMVKLVVPKLQNAKAKGGTAKFMSDTIRGLQLKLSLQESEQLHKTCKEFLTKRKKKEQEIAA